MHDLGFISDVTKRLRRNKKLVYTGKVLKGRVSPLKCLLSVVMSIRRTDIKVVAKMLKSDSQLRLLEAAKVVPKEMMRLFQRSVSISVFGKLDKEGHISDDFVRKRFSTPDLEWILDHRLTINKYARLVDRERRLHDDFVHDLGLIPLDKNFVKN